MSITQCIAAGLITLGLADALAAASAVAGAVVVPVMAGTAVVGILERRAQRIRSRLRGASRRPAG